MISDPGFVLVREVRAAGYKVVPVPGCCAMVAALSAAGIASDRFAFEGFVPAKSQQRLSFYENLSSESRSLIFMSPPSH
ncbi:SAM-dependent methyltransferase [Aliamphritea spongicola]